MRDLSSFLIFLLCGLIAGTVTNADAQTTDALLVDLAEQTNSGMTFLTDSFGARARSLGTAFAAIADDGSAAANNPAGIAQIRRSQLNVTRPLDNLGISSEGLFVYVQPIGEDKSAGASIYVNHPADNEVEQILNVAYAWQLQADSRIYVGIGGKIFSRDGPIAFNGVAVDFGILAQPIGRDIILGLVAQNFGPDVRLRYNPERFPSTLADVDIIPLAPTNSEIPFNLRFGIAYQSELFMLPYQVSGQVDKSTLNSFIRGSLGVEFQLQEAWALRAGYTAESDVGQALSLGLGFRYQLMQIGYTYIHRENHPNQHEVYLAIDFLNRTPAPPMMP